MLALSMSIKLLILFIFIFSNTNAYALTLKLSRVMGSERAEFGESGIKGVLQLSSSGTVFDIETDDTWFYGLTYSNYNFEANNASISEGESSWDLYGGRSFGRSKNKLSFIVGVGSSSNSLPTLESSVVKFKQTSFNTKLLSTRLTTEFLSFQYYLWTFDSSKVGELEIHGKRISHKVSFNLGKKLKYGVYYLNQKYDLVGEHDNWKNQSLYGIYVGFKWK
jgi:hypothetical protein